MTWQEFLTERPIAVIATVSADGMPHAVPVEVFVHENRVYCWGHRTSLKARNVAETSVAALTAYKGHTRAIVRGPARLLAADDPLYDVATEGILAKYQREETYGNDCVIQITPTKVVFD